MENIKAILFGMAIVMAGIILFMAATVFSMAMKGIIMLAVVIGLYGLYNLLKRK